MTKQDILEYITKSPENTNYSVMSSLLDQFHNSDYTIVEIELDWDNYLYTMRGDTYANVYATIQETAYSVIFVIEDADTHSSKFVSFCSAGSDCINFSRFGIGYKLLADGTFDEQGMGEEEPPAEEPIGGLN